MAMIDTSWGYSILEAPFVRYFDRLASIGKTPEEIERVNLPQLERYYYQMVIARWNDFSFGSPKLINLFNDWKRNV